MWAGPNPVIQQPIQQSNGRSDESANRASDPKYESEPWVWAEVWAKIQVGFSLDSQLWVLTQSRLRTWLRLVDSALYKYQIVILRVYTRWIELAHFYKWGLW